MLCIKDSRTDPWFNLAAEEYILKNIKEDCFRLWRDEPCIVVGKHQNAFAEINPWFVDERKIKVVRRISGGGAVYHDPGNLNFTFVASGEEGNLVNFRKFTQPVLDILHEMGLEAEFGGKNDLLTGGKKFSGNAEHVWKKRILHHGTLLFSTDMNDLSAALKADLSKYKDKAVKSIRSKVTNISGLLSEKTGILEFRDRIMQRIMEIYPASAPYEFSPEDIAGIEKLREEKFSKWEWNFGYSPKYDFTNKISGNDGEIEFRLHVENGIIREIRILHDFSPKTDLESIERSLTGIKHDISSVIMVLSRLRPDKYFENISLEDFVAGMF